MINYIIIGLIILCIIIAFIFARKNKRKPGGCCGNCSGCSISSCGSRIQEKDDELR